MDILVLFFLEVLFRGPGYLLVNLFKKPKPDPNSFLVIFASLLFWAVTVTAIYTVYTHYNSVSI